MPHFVQGQARQTARLAPDDPHAPTGRPRSDCCAAHRRGCPSLGTSQATRSPANRPQEVAPKSNRPPRRRSSVRTQGGETASRRAHQEAARLVRIRVAADPMRSQLPLRPLRPHSLGHVPRLLHLAGLLSSRVHRANTSASVSPLQRKPGRLCRHEREWRQARTNLGAYGKRSWTMSIG